MSVFVQSLFIYPVKGVRAVPLKEARVEARGLDGDRRWIVTDEDGVFLTQRDCPALARIEAQRHRMGLFLRKDGGDLHFVPWPEGEERRSIEIWLDRVEAAPAGASADAWLTGALGRPARLFHMDDAAERRTPATFAAPSPVSFADAYPILITTTASLAALNDEIAANGGEGVGMERFRPNIVVGGADAWAEDRWRAIRIGQTVLDLVKPCDRCVVTTTDQRTGERMGKEPLASLARIRKSADPQVSGVLFGWNVVVREAGGIAVGDAVAVAQRRESAWRIE